MQEKKIFFFYKNELRKLKKESFSRVRLKGRQSHKRNEQSGKNNEILLLTNEHDVWNNNKMAVF